MKLSFNHALPSILLAVIAIVLALVGLSQSPLETSKDTQKESNVSSIKSSSPMYSYLVALSSIDAGSEISNNNIATVFTDSPIEGAINAAEFKSYKKPLNAITRGETISTHHFINQSKLARHIEPGHQAIALQIDHVSGVGGLLGPGDKVNVSVYFKKTTKKQASTLMLLKSIVVLAISGSFEKDVKDTDKKRNNTVVLMVPDEHVSKLLLSASAGSIRLTAAPIETLTLQNTNKNTNVTSIDFIQLNDLFPQKKKVEKHQRMPVKRSQVHILEGTKGKNVYVQ